MGGANFLVLDTSGFRRSSLHWALGATSMPKCGSQEFGYEQSLEAQNGGECQNNSILPATGACASKISGDIL